jgi:hypothetical protein
MNRLRICKLSMNHPRYDVDKHYDRRERGREVDEYRVDVHGLSLDADDANRQLARRLFVSFKLLTKF